MCEDYIVNRRDLLKRGLSASSLAFAGAPFIAQLMQATDAFAQGSDYRALVCLYLSGGCDGLTMLVPYDTTNHNRYKQVRGSLAVDRTKALKLSPVTSQNGLEAALHPALTRTKALFDQKRLAIVSNVGPLIQPVTKAQYESPQPPPLPPAIGSHVDQYAYWLQLAAEGRIPTGWGGRLADKIVGSNQRAVLTAVSANLHSPLLAGQFVTQFTVSEFGSPANFIDAGGPFEKLVGKAETRTNLLAKAYARVHDRLRDGADDLSAEILPTSAVPAFSGNISLARQLETIARIAGAGPALGMRRQIFYANLGGFDTHASQNRDFENNMMALDAALGHFDACLGALGLRDKVTLFTASEFGRSLTPNGDGTDHAWGGHHLVMGGAVKGGDIYGKLPTIGTDSESFGKWGHMIPQFSVEQYGATLGRWFGVPDSAMPDVFPNLKNFNSANIGFMA